MSSQQIETAGKAEIVEGVGCCLIRRYHGSWQTYMIMESYASQLSRKYPSVLSNPIETRDMAKETQRQTMRRALYNEEARLTTRSSIKRAIGTNIILYPTPGVRAVNFTIFTRGEVGLGNAPDVYQGGWMELDAIADSPDYHFTNQDEDQVPTALDAVAQEHLRICIRTIPPGKVENWGPIFTRFGVRETHRDIKKIMRNRKTYELHIYRDGEIPCLPTRFYALYEESDKAVLDGLKPTSLSAA